MQNKGFTNVLIMFFTFFAVGNNGMSQIRALSIRKFVRFWLDKQLFE